MDRGIMCFTHCCAGCGVYRRPGASTIVCPGVLGFNGILLCLYDVYEFTILYLSYMLCMTTGCVDAGGYVTRYTCSTTGQGLYYLYQLGLNLEQSTTPNKCYN